MAGEVSSKTGSDWPGWAGKFSGKNAKIGVGNGYDQKHDEENWWEISSTSDIFCVKKEGIGEEERDGLCSV